MKSKEELKALKEEVEAVNEKLAELTPEEIAQVSGGADDAGFLAPTSTAGASLGLIEIAGDFPKIHITK